MDKYGDSKNGIKTNKVIVEEQPYRPESQVSSEVRREIRQIKDGSYIVIKRIKGNADIPVGRGYWNGKELVICDDRLDVDYRVVGANVIEYHEEEER